MLGAVPEEPPAREPGVDEEHEYYYEEEEEVWDPKANWTTRK